MVFYRIFLLYLSKLMIKNKIKHAKYKILHIFDSAFHLFFITFYLLFMIKSILKSVLKLSFLIICPSQSRERMKSELPVY
jgi:hypothetical protein